MRSPETLTIRRVPFLPLLKKELWEVVGGRALWTMLLLVCPLALAPFARASELTVNSINDQTDAGRGSVA